MSKLVIVESPAKAKTIQKYLGAGYDVIASMGHLIDLPKSTLGVDVENGFKPKYITIKGKEKLIKELKNAAKGSDKVYLATDPDREGEAISWHLASALSLDLNDQNRVTFDEITKSGVKTGMKNPRKVDLNLVNAQQTRRILDRIVGYKLSPFLWKKVKRGLSAGRVQSVAVSMIVDREEEIRAFESQEYWNIEATFTAPSSKKEFTAKFVGDKKGKIELSSKEESDKILKALEGAAYAVTDVKTGVRKKSPAPPFTTSTLQQEASRRLGFQSSRTMRIAQQLYEGVDVKGQGATGLITYMRTDSLRISEEAKSQARAFISEKYSDKYLPEKPRFYAKKKGTQDAHEAIRPTNAQLTPQSIKGSLTSDQYRLYKLVWERFVASQMADAILDTAKVQITANGYLFGCSGYSVVFDGFTALYEVKDDGGEEDPAKLPKMAVGDSLKLIKMEDSQHFTQPPSRYTEASLIKMLEENGIGRPSTYAPTIMTILNRGYVEREGKTLKPTAAGEVTTKLMRDFFSSIINVEFTANMETNLDEIEEGKMDWVKTLGEFYEGFDKTLQDAEKAMDGTRVKIPDEVTDVICDKCGRNMVIKNGRFGKFLACPGYPECKNTKKLVVETGGICPLCGGKVLQKRSKNGKIFYGCEHNPDCSFMTWDIPLPDKCPKCGNTLYKKKYRGGKVYCVKDGCGYVREKK